MTRDSAKIASIKKCPPRPSPDRTRFGRRRGGQLRESSERNRRQETGSAGEDLKCELDVSMTAREWKMMMARRDSNGNKKSPVNKFYSV